MKDENMFIGLDRDTGRADAATPATRGDAEEALRQYTSGTTDTAEAGKAGETEDSCPNGCPDGVCLGDVFEAVIDEAQARDIKPDAPEFGEIFERVFAEKNPDSGVKVKFLGAHKDGEPMPDELADKLDASGFDPVLNFPFDLTTKELDGLFRGLPPIPNIFDILKPSLDSTALTPLPLPYREPMTSTLGGDADREPSLDEMLSAIFAPPKTALAQPMSLETTDEDVIEQERRAVVQDLASAAADMVDLVGEPGAEDAFAALRDIAALARDTYEI